MAEKAKGYIKGIRWLVVALAIMIGMAGCGNAKETSLNEENSKQGIRDTRMVKDAFGEVEIPVKPKKVAGIYLEDYITALGVTPVVQWYHPAWGKQDYLELKDVPLFDITGSLEALLEKEPDLIIVDGGVDKAAYQLYSKIAPTYRLPDNINGNAEETLKTVADLLGIPEKATSVLNDYKEKVADTKKKLEKAIGHETVAVVRLNVGDKPGLNVFGLNNVFIGMIYKDLGLEPFSMVKETDKNEVISQEKIPEFTADHIFILPSNGTWDTANKKAVALLDDPLWKNLPAVKNGHVYQVERSYWQSGAIIADTMKMDDLLKYLVK